MRYVLMHISDLHAGPAFNPIIADKVVYEARELKPDLLVVSGDLVQRADFVNQWNTINAFLKRLPQPRLIVPGNHDVPLYHVHERLFRPLDRYKRYISPDLNPVFERPGLIVVGGNTAHGLTNDGGFLRREQQIELERTFKRYPDNTCKVAVFHHHLVSSPGSEHRSKIKNAIATVQLLDRCNVELLLCGHIHISYIGTTLDVRPHMQKGTIICQSGTTTSRRGKHRERGKNSYNVIEIEDEVIRIGQHLYLENIGRFVPVAEHIFPRRSAGVYTLPRTKRVIEADMRLE